MHYKPDSSMLAIVICAVLCIPVYITEIWYDKPVLLQVCSFSFSWDVFCATRGSLRCWLPGGSSASSEPRRYDSVPSILALAALIRQPSSTCAHT